MACLTLLPAAVEFAYFTGLAGAGMALLTPDMGASWPWQFFLNHGGIIVAATVLVFGGLAPLRAGAMWRAYGWFSLYIALVGIFNWIFGTNYAFLCAKPSWASLLTVMGPWPIYIFAGGGVALAMFWMLSLPVRPKAVSLVVERELCAS